MAKTGWDGMEVGGGVEVGGMEVGGMEVGDGVEVGGGGRGWGGTLELRALL